MKVVKLFACDKGSTYDEVPGPVTLSDPEDAPMAAQILYDLQAGFPGSIKSKV